MFVVGLTGGIGSGKTVVSSRFARLGAAVIDADLMARALTAPGGQALPAIRAAFGAAVFDPAGELDRRVLRQRVFGDAEARKTLEAIVHPMIRNEVEQAMTGVSGPYALLVVPLMLETGAYRDRVQRLLVVDCPRAVRIERVMARSGLTREEVEAIVATQATDTQRREAADDTIDNAGTLDALDAAVATLHVRYLDLAQRALSLRPERRQ